MTQDTPCLLTADAIRHANDLLDRTKEALALVEPAAHPWNAWLDQAGFTIAQWEAGTRLAMQLAESGYTVAQLAVGTRLAMQLAQILADALYVLQDAHTEWTSLVDGRRQLWEADRDQPGLGAELLQEYKAAELTLENLHSMSAEIDENYESIWACMDELDEVFADVYGLESPYCLCDKLPQLQDGDEDDEELLELYGEADGDEEDPFYSPDEEESDC